MEMDETSYVPNIAFQIAGTEFKFMLEQPKITWQFTSTDKDICSACIGQALAIELAARFVIQPDAGYGVPK